MALILKDLDGNAYPVETVTNHTVRMNSDGMLTFNVIENEQTAHFINDISKMWRVENMTGDAESQTYVVVIAKRKATKHKQYIEVTAKEEQFDYLETHRIYENVTGSRTGVDFLNLIFDDTPYSYTLLESVYAKEWENAGDGQSRFEMFLNWLERYGFEFQYEPTSKTFKLGARISRRPAYYISKKLNANDISFEEDATSFYTYARGFFDYDGADNIHAANQIREYPKDKSSPMIELFGIREAPPVTDGRVTDKDLMDEMLEKQVEQSLKMSIELDFVTLGHNYPFAQPEIGDEIPVIDETINFNRVLRIQEIKTTRDAHHKVIKQTIVVGDPRREVRYKKSQSGAVSAINDLMAGRRKIKESVLPAAIKESTQMLMDTASELSFSEQGIMAVDKDNPNYVTLLNSSGLGVSKDGGQTFHNAITRGQINADLITAGSLNADYIRGGSLDANLVNVVGGDDGDYISMTNDTINSKGSFRRTWANITDTANLNLGIRKGRIMVSNEDTGYNLYMTEKGLSTMMDGAGDETAGTLEFHSQRFNETSRGVTLHSTYGAVALLSENSRIYTRSRLTNNIESEQYGVYVRPYKFSRVGVNEFNFYVKDNPSATETDGALLYGNLSGSGTKMGSGIRFGKQLPVVYATNESGDIGTGYFYGAGFQGDWMAKGSNVYACVNGALRVTDMNGYNNGFPNYKDLDAKDIRANSIRVNTGHNLYLGTSTGEVRVTNNLLYNGGNIGYKPIRAEEFATDTSLRANKKNIEIYDKDVRDTFRNMSVYQYNRNIDEDGERKQLGAMLDEFPQETYSKAKDSFGLYALTSFIAKGLKDEILRNDKLEEKIKKLEELENGK